MGKEESTSTMVPYKEGHISNVRDLAMARATTELIPATELVRSSAEAIAVSTAVVGAALMPLPRTGLKRSGLESEAETCTRQCF